MGCEVPQKKHPAEPDGTQRYDYPVYGRFHVIGKLQAVEVGEVAAVDVMPRVVAVKIRWKVNTTSSAFILRVGVNQSVLKRNIAT